MANTVCEQNGDDDGGRLHKSHRSGHVTTINDTALIQDLCRGNERDSTDRAIRGGNCSGVQFIQLPLQQLIAYKGNRNRQGNRNPQADRNFWRKA